MQRLLWCATVIALLGAGCASPRGTLDARKHYWQNRLERELPSGSKLSAAQAFFESAHLEPHYYAQSSTLIAAERNVAHSFMVSWDITTVRLKLEQTELVS